MLVKFFGFTLPFATAALIGDWLTKLLVVDRLKGKPPYVIFESWFKFDYVENRGMAFGIGRNMPYARYILTGLGLVALFFVWQKVSQIQHRQKLGAIAFGLILGGAIGNIIDRLMNGFVTDFIVNFWRTHYWPAYNIADSCICVGVGLLLIAFSGERSIRTMS